MGRGRSAAGVGVLLLVAACGRDLPPGWLYVTGVTSTAATVVWTGAAEAVRCGSGGATRDTPGRRGRGGVRVARVDGLAPRTVYRCRLAPTVVRRGFRFRTAPAGPASFVFAAVGDTGDGSQVAARLARRILAGRPDFLVHLGDFAYPRGSAAEYARAFFRPYARLLARVPVMPTPGNHDLTRRSVYRELFASLSQGDDGNGPHYSFDWGPAHFASVSSPEFGRDATGGAAWLRADLATVPPGWWRFVFLHEPVYTAGAKVTVPGLRAGLEPVVEAAHVDVVLSGHQHFYERARAACQYTPDATVLHVISGGGGANLDPAAEHPNFARAASATHYLRIRVTADEIDLRAVDVSGHVLDHVRRRRGDRPACIDAGWPEPHDR